MGFNIGDVVGTLYSLEEGGEVKTMLENVTCTNGMGWTMDGKSM
jgi:sugar lactone lactonase YvrE